MHRKIMGNFARVNEAKAHTLDTSHCVIAAQVKLKAI